MSLFKKDNTALEKAIENNKNLLINYDAWIEFIIREYRNEIHQRAEERSRNYPNVRYQLFPPDIHDVFVAYDKLQNMLAKAKTRAQTVTALSTGVPSVVRAIVDTHYCIDDYGEDEIMRYKKIMSAFRIHFSLNIADGSENYSDIYVGDLSESDRRIIGLFRDRKANDSGR